MLRYLKQAVINTVPQCKCSPLELIYFVTNRCNLSCAHCFVDKKSSNDAELSISEIKKLASDIPQLMSLMLTGGEPFLRDDLSEIVSIFDKYSAPKVISITTNGILTEKITSLLDALTGMEIRALLNLSISLDGDSHTHNRMRGSNNAFDALMRSVLMINGHPARKKILFGINITVSAGNVNVPTEFYGEFVRKHAMDYASVNLARSSNQGEYSGTDIGYYDELSAYINKHNAIKIRNIPGILHGLHAKKECFQAQKISNTYRDRKYQGIICEAGRNIGVIGPTGNVYPCELLTECFGSVRESSFAAIWNNKANKLFASKNIRGKRCFCHHECFLSASILTNILNQLKMLLWLFVKKNG